MVLYDLLIIYNMPLHIKSTTKSARVLPKSKDELRSIIEQELEQQGPTLI